MSAFLVMIHGFTNIVQERTCLGDHHVGAELGCKDTTQLGDFYSMGELVLTVGCTVFQTAHHA